MTTNMNTSDDNFDGREERDNTLLRLQSNDPSLQEVSFDHLRRFPDFSYALGHGLATNNHLQSLFLGQLKITRPLACALANGIRLSKIKNIRFHGSVCAGGLAYHSPESQEIRLILHRALAMSQTIRSLSWYLPDNTEAGGLIGLGDILASLATLQELLIYACRSGNEVAQLLIEVLPRSSSAITTLKLDVGPLSDDTMQQLVQQLHRMPAITNLGLGEICDRRLPLVEGLFPTLRLSKLALCFNDLTLDGVKRLVQDIIDGRLHPLQELNLAYGQNFGYAGVQFIIDSLTHLPSHLERIDITGCAMRRLDHSESETLARALLNGVHRNCFFKHLLMEELDFSADFKSTIDLYHTLNRNGRYLLSPHHGLPPTVWCHILTRFHQDQTLSASCIYFYLRELPTLVQPRVVWSTEI